MRVVAWAAHPDDLETLAGELSQNTFLLDTKSLEL